MFNPNSRFFTLVNNSATVQRSLQFLEERRYMCFLNKNAVNCKSDLLIDDQSYSDSESCRGLKLFQTAIRENLKQTLKLLNYYNFNLVFGILKFTITISNWLLDFMFNIFIFYKEMSVWFSKQRKKIKRFRILRDRLHCI